MSVAGISVLNVIKTKKYGTKNKNYEEHRSKEHYAQLTQNK